MVDRLSDGEIGERLMAAWEDLNSAAAQSDVGRTTLEAAKTALVLLYAGLKRASDEGSDENPVITPPTQPAPAESPS